MIGLYFSLLIFAVILIFGIIVTRVLGEKLLRGNKINWIFSGYAIVLLIGSLLVFFLPEKGSFKGEVLSDEEVAAQQRLTERLYQLVVDGKINEIEGIVEKEKWEFPFEGEQLTFESQDQDYQYTMIFVEEATDLEGKAEVFHYATRSSLENVDITDKLTSPQMKLNGTTLNLLPAKQVEIKLEKLSNPFPFNQFSEEKIDDDEDNFFGPMGSNHGSEVIYIRVPAGTKVSGDVQYLNKR